MKGGGQNFFCSLMNAGMLLNGRKSEFCHTISYFSSEEKQCKPFLESHFRMCPQLAACKLNFLTH